MRRISLIACISILVSIQLKGQLANGSIAPNWTLTDIFGNTHTLYDYLDQGKTVVLDFSATWCGPCWNYHNSGALESFYNIHGPSGTNESMVFMIESDLSTGLNDLYGLTPGTAGNWVSGTPYPIIDVTSNTVPNDYSISFYPTIYKICSDRTIYEVGQVGTSTLTNWIQSCTLTADLLSVTSTTCFGMGDGAIDILVSGGMGTPSFSWSNGAETQNLIGIEGGLYSVTVTELQGKIAVVEGILVEGPDQQLTLDEVIISDLPCYNDMSGAISVQGVGGNGGYSYAWSNNSTTQIINGLAAGTYTVTLSDQEGCFHVQEFEIHQPELLDWTFDVENELCDQGNGSISINAFGGTPPFTVEVNQIVLPGDQFEIFDLTAGTYSIVLTDQNGCYVADELTISNVPGPEIIGPGALHVDCYNNLITIDITIINVTGEIEYDWSTSTGIIESSYDDEDILVSAPGSYYVEVEFPGTGCTAEDSYFVSGNLDQPEVSAGPDKVIDCNALNAVLDGAIADLPSNALILWTTPDGNIVDGAATLQPVVDAPGSYQLSIQNLDNGCIGYDTVIVEDLRQYSEAAFSFIINELEVSFTNLSTGPVDQFSWDFSDGTTTDEQSPVHYFNESGVYQVCLTTVNGCGQSVSCQDIEVHENATAILFSGEISDAGCNAIGDGAIDLEVSGGAGDFTFTWTGPNGFSASDKNISGLVAGIYTVIISDVDGNTTMGQFFIDEPSLIQAAYVAVEPLCFGDGTGTIELIMAGGTPPYSYLWSTGSNTHLIQVEAGQYSCTVTDSNDCQYIVEDVSINEPPLIEAEYLAADALCFGEQTGTIEVIIAGGTPPFFYEWNNGAGGQAIEVASGQYSCTVTDANGCQEMIEDVIISEPPPLEYEAIAYSTIFGLNGSIDLEVNGGTPPYTYLWSNGSTQEDPGGLSLGIYTCTITDANGCILKTAEISISIEIDQEYQSPGEDKIELYPNPFRNQFTIRFTGVHGQQGIIAVTNVIGEEIDTRNFTDNTVRFNTADWAEGIYFVRSKIGDETSILKVIKGVE